MNYYLHVLKNYTVFSGRARRSEYWFFVLFNVIVALVVGIIDGVLHLQIGRSNNGVLGTIYSLAVLIPSIAVLVRRLHDTNRSGWWVLIGLIPIIGAIVLIVFAVMDSTPGSNDYGPNPKGVTTTTSAPANTASAAAPVTETVAQVQPEVQPEALAQSPANDQATPQA